MTDTIMNNPFMALLVGVVVIAIIIYKVTGKKGLDKMKEFKPKLFTETVYDDFKDKLKVQGIKMKGGRLHIGFNEIARVECYLISKGRLPDIKYDKDNNKFDFKPKKEDKEYEFLIIRCKSKNMILRIFGVSKMFFVINMDPIKGAVKFDEKEKKIFLPTGTDMISYGNVWMNDDYAMEYINDISLKRQMEAQMTHVENFPDRVVHLETELAKKERMSRTMAEIEKAKYDRRKSGDDTVMS